MKIKEESMSKLSLKNTGHRDTHRDPCLTMGSHDEAPKKAEGHRATHRATMSVTMDLCI